MTQFSTTLKQGTQLGTALLSQRSPYERQRANAHGIPSPGRSIRACWPTSARSARVAGATTASTPRVLEVDRIRPTSEGGTDAYDNLTLLCPPCNKAKKDLYTLTGLQARNRTEGHLPPEREGYLRHGRAQRTPPRRRRR